jgi:hypothetical protein
MDPNAMNSNHVFLESDVACPEWRSIQCLVFSKPECGDGDNTAQPRENNVLTDGTYAIFRCDETFASASNEDSQSITFLVD